MGERTAVPDTVPEGWVGCAEVRERVKDQRVARRLKRVSGLEGGGAGSPLGSCSGLVSCRLAISGMVGCGSGDQIESCVAGFLIDGSADGLVEGEDMSTLFTLCSVARLGFSAGLLVVIQLRRCFISVLSMFLGSLGFCKFAAPLSSTYRHRYASAVPTERSLPVGQQISVFAGVSFSSELGTDPSWCRAGSWFRRSREPSLPVWQGRWRYDLTPASTREACGSGSGVQLITVSYEAKSTSWLAHT